MSNFVNRTQGHFTIIENAFLNDPLIYFKEKGLYAFLASKPPGWRFSAMRISKQTKEGRKAVLNSLNTLERYGLLTRKKLQSGQLQYILHLPSERMKDFPESQKGTVAQCTKGTVQKADSISNTNSLERLSNERENSPSEELGQFYFRAVDIETNFPKSINSNDQLISWARFLMRNNICNDDIFNAVCDRLVGCSVTPNSFKKEYDKLVKKTQISSAPVVHTCHATREVTSEELESLKGWGIIDSKEAGQ
ncbi:MAG: helix-turn-helix domain-containing protein [Lentisphaeraceae bacterium]|nr:helix-turn-helix domain-containing protein [Lentisphaeraceae bacterium]